MNKVKIKCNSCAYEWYYAPDWTSPYGEWTCMKTETDLYGTEDKDVENCLDYELKTNDNRYYEDVIQDIKSYKER